MAVTTTPSHVRHEVTTTAATLPAPFRFRSGADLAVVVERAGAPDDELVYGVDYTVTGGQTVAGGTVAFTPALVGPCDVVILRATPALQDRRLPDVGRLPAEAIEAALDRLTLGLQELGADMAGAVRLPRGQAAPPLPAPAARANGTLAFGPAGDLMVAAGVSTTPVTAAWAALLAQASVDTAIAPFLEVAAVGDIAALRAKTWTDDARPELVVLMANWVLGDGGGAFRWDAASTVPDDGGIIIKEAATATGRWVRQHEDGRHEAVWWGVLDNAADRAAVLSAAIAASANATLILPAATIRLDTSVPVNVSNITIVGQGMRSTILNCNRVASPQFVLGDALALKTEIKFAHMLLNGVVGQILFQTDWVRGVRFEKVKATTDQWLALGVAASGTLKPTYIVEANDCELNCVAAPTRHFVEALNFSGQWVMVNVFGEGHQTSAAIDGFHATSNIQQRIDDFKVIGGYWSRWQHNYNFQDARVVNLTASDTHISEGAWGNAFRFFTTSATTKPVGHVGWEEVSISGKVQSLNDVAILARSERVGTSQQNLSIVDLQVVVAGKTPIVIQSDAGALDTVLIDNVTLDITPIDGDQDGILIAGGVATTTIANVSIGQITGKANATALRAAVRLIGRMARVSPPAAIAVDNVTTPFDDQTSTTPMSMGAAELAVGDVLTILDQSADHHRAITAQRFVDQVDRVRTRPLQAFRLWIRNNGGTIEHLISQLGAQTAAAADLVAKINGAAASWTATPTGTDATTAMVAGAKIGTTNPEYIILDTPDQAASNLSPVFATVAFNTSGVALSCYAFLASRNVNGVTRTRLEIGLLRADTGGGRNINTANWAAGAITAIDIWGYLA